MPEAYRNMLSGHSMGFGARAYYNSAKKHTALTKLQELYDKHMNNEAGGYFPIESLRYSEKDLARLKKTNSDYCGRVLKAIGIVDRLIATIKKKHA
jgi:hypothetical protein